MDLGRLLDLSESTNEEQYADQCGSGFGDGKGRSPTSEVMEELRSARECDERRVRLGRLYGHRHQARRACSACATTGATAASSPCTTCATRPCRSSSRSARP